MGMGAAFFHVIRSAGMAAMTPPLRARTIHGYLLLSGTEKFDTISDSMELRV
ncbi:hypothetical protein J3E61_004357 [Mycobacterium sp. OAE908]